MNDHTLLPCVQFLDSKQKHQMRHLNKTGKPQRKKTRDQFSEQLSSRQDKQPCSRSSLARWEYRPLEEKLQSCQKVKQKNGDCVEQLYILGNCPFVIDGGDILACCNFVQCSSHENEVWEGGQQRATEGKGTRRAWWKVCNWWACLHTFALTCRILSKKAIFEILNWTG